MLLHRRPYLPVAHLVSPVKCLVYGVYAAPQAQPTQSRFWQVNRGSNGRLDNQTGTQATGCTDPAMLVMEPGSRAPWTTIPTETGQMQQHTSHGSIGAATLGCHNNNAVDKRVADYLLRSCSRTTMHTFLS